MDKDNFTFLLPSLPLPFKSNLHGNIAQSNGTATKTSHPKRLLQQHSLLEIKMILLISLTTEMCVCVATPYSLRSIILSSMPTFQKEIFPSGFFGLNFVIMS